MKHIIRMNNVMFFVLFLTTQLIPAQKAVTIVPVADLVNQPLCPLHAHQKASDVYKNLPEFDSKLTCPRIHQLLFNEIVDVIQERGDEVNIRLSNIFCTSEAKPKTKSHAQFWTAKRNIISFKDLQGKNITPDLFPSSIDFNQATIAPHNKNTATLIMPFRDPATKKTFSAGTRFVRTGKQTKNALEVFIYDAKAQRVKKSSIPKSVCFIESGQSQKERQQAFLSIIKRWAHLSDGFIPYVWGGCSFVKPEKRTFKQYPQQTKDNKTTTVFTYHNKRATKKGLDCSGLITRAAQICGIPYFLKNSTTIAHNLTELKPGESISPGDIIWFRGHVLVVSDIEKNSIIEARGYSGSYGKVHEIGLNKLFREIKTYDDLLKAVRTRQKLTVVGKNGQETSKVYQVKMFKFASVWN